MQLGTFGAVMGFALEIEKQLASFYETALLSLKDSELKALLHSLCQDVQRDCATLEQTRREHVTEMILEPISGLKRYGTTVDVSVPKSDVEILNTAVWLEERDRAFSAMRQGRCLFLK